MPRRKEIPLSPVGAFDYESDTGIGNSPLEYQASRTIQRAPETVTEALMQAPPSETPLLAREELLPLRDVIADAMDQVLTPRERWVFERSVIERQPLRGIAADLGLCKSVIDRTKQRAARKLSDALVSEPRIEKYLRRGETAT